MTTLALRRPDGSRSVLTLTRTADASAPVVLLVPAMGMRAGYYAPFAAALQAAGVATAVHELRGHEAGPGARRPGWSYDFGYDDLVADLAAAVDLVAATLPDAPLVVLGHSMGGHVACGWVAGDPRRAVGLVLVASGTTHWRAWPRRLHQLVRTQAAYGLARAVGHFPGHRVGFAGREARGVLRDWARLARTGRLAPGRRPRDLSAALAAADLPVLAVSVEGDVLSPRPTVVAMAAAFAGADVELVHVTPGDAGPALDHFRWARHPEPVLAALTPWLRRVTRGA